MALGSSNHGGLSAKDFICLGIWLVAMIAFVVQFFFVGDVFWAMMSLAGAMLLGMIVVAWGGSDLNNL